MSHPRVTKVHVTSHCHVRRVGRKGWVCVAGRRLARCCPCHGDANARASSSSCSLEAPPCDAQSRTSVLGRCEAPLSFAVILPEAVRSHAVAAASIGADLFDRGRAHRRTVRARQPKCAFARPRSRDSCAAPFGAHVQSHAWVFFFDFPRIELGLGFGLGLRLRRRDQEISSQSPQDLNWAILSRHNLQSTHSYSCDRGCLRLTYEALITQSAPL